MKFYINNMSDSSFLGLEIDSYFYLNDFRLTVGSNSREYANVALTDVTGTVCAKMWSESFTGEEQSMIGLVVHVLAKISLYDGKPSMQIAVMKVADESEYLSEDIIPQISEEKVNELYAYISEKIEIIEEPRLNGLVKKVFDKSIRKMRKLPAALNMHHSFNGGVLIHTAEVLSIALNYCDVYEMHSSCRNYAVQIDKDLVIAGAVLHDIGKIGEYKSYPGAEITKRGRLVGHLCDGATYVTLLNQEQEKENRVEDLSELLHIILSSHGSSSEIKPQTMEAFIISNADNMSAECDYVGLFSREFSMKHPDTRCEFGYSPEKGRMIALKEVLNE